MLNLQLNVEPKTAQRLSKILNAHPDQEAFARNIIAYQAAELRKGVLDLRLDMKEFEEKYQISTEEFYRRFEEGIADDREDYVLWAGLYEMLCENKLELAGLE